MYLPMNPYMMFGANRQGGYGDAVQIQSPEPGDQAFLHGLSAGSEAAERWAQTRDVRAQTGQRQAQTDEINSETAIKNAQTAIFQKQIQDMADKKAGALAFQQGGTAWDDYTKAHADLAPGIMKDAADASVARTKLLNNFFATHTNVDDATRDIKQLQTLNPGFQGWNNPKTGLPDNDEFMHDRDLMLNHTAKLSPADNLLQAAQTSLGAYQESHDQKDLDNYNDYMQKWHASLDNLKASTKQKDASANLNYSHAAWFGDAKQRNFQFVPDKVIKDQALPLVAAQYPNLSPTDQTAMASYIANSAKAKGGPGGNLAMGMQSELMNASRFIKHGNKGIFWNDPDTLDYSQMTGGGQSAAQQQYQDGQKVPVNMRKQGQIYSTPKGPMQWTGSGWLPQQ